MIKCPQWMAPSMENKWHGKTFSVHVTEKLSPVSKWEENENGSFELSLNLVFEQIYLRTVNSRFDNV